MLSAGAVGGRWASTHVGYVLSFSLFPGGDTHNEICSPSFRILKKLTMLFSVEEQFFVCFPLHNSTKTDVHRASRSAHYDAAL